MKKQASPFLIGGILLLGVVMRVPFTVIPAILSDIAQSFGVSVSELGLLTSIPLMMFALFSSLVPRMAAKLGMERLIILALVVMSFGSVIRMFSLPSLYVGTFLIGAGVAVINVLLPSLISVHFPRKIGFYTMLYTTTMGISTTVASMVVVPIVSRTSWQWFVGLLTGILLFAVFFWLPNARIEPQVRREVTTNSSPAPSLWKNKKALIFLLFGGLQSLLFYTEMAWLPTMTQTAGLSQADAGSLFGLFSLITLPISMILPGVLAKQTARQRAWLMVGLSSLTLIGLFLMVLAPADFGYWLVIHLILGFSTGGLFPYMMLSFSLKTSNSQATAALSGMVQTGGYLLAAIGPVCLGYSYELTRSWTPLLLVLGMVTVVMMGTIFLIEKEETIL